MKSKKLLSLLLALAMVMSMAACGAKTNEPPATSGTPSETGAPATEELNWPTKEITLIQPWSLGGGPDVITRQIASYSDKILGVPMIVENHTGGSGTIGMNDFLEAEDDGYTLFCCNGPLFSLTPSFIDVDYTIDDISPICGIRITEFVILSNASSKITYIQELKDYAAAGHTVKYATTGGPGNDSYTMISALFALLDIPCEAVPYDGGQEAINALVGGHVDIAIGSPPTYRDYVINGQLNCLGTFIPEVWMWKALATSLPSRSRALTWSSPVWTIWPSVPLLIPVSRKSCASLFWKCMPILSSRRSWLAWA